MHTVKNITHGPHDVKSSIGLVRMGPGDTLTADFESTYLRLLRNGRSFEVSEAGETAAGLVRASETTEAPPKGEKPAETPLQAVQTVSEPDAPPTTREGWADLASKKGINVKSSWGINRIKAEIEKAS